MKRVNLGFSFWVYPFRHECGLWLIFKNDRSWAEFITGADISVLQVLLTEQTNQICVVVFRITGPARTPGTISQSLDGAAQG